MTIERDGEPFARVDAYPSCGGPFVEFAVWNAIVAFGWAGAVHLVDPAARQVGTIDCDTYFGHLYPLDDKLLIASASDLICVARDSSVVWKSDCLGIDGVVVDRVADGIVTGRGEWDPPGGWRPFRLSLTSGRPAAG